MTEWLLDGLRFFAGVVVLVGIWQLGSLIWEWIKERWL